MLGIVFQKCSKDIKIIPHAAAFKAMTKLSHNIISLPLWLIMLITISCFLIGGMAARVCACKSCLLIVCDCQQMGCYFEPAGDTSVCFLHDRKIHQCQRGLEWPSEHQFCMMVCGEILFVCDFHL